PVQQLPGEALRCRCIRERITAGIVVDLVLSDVRIDRQQSPRTEGVLIAGGDIPGQDSLMLVLGQLIVVVGYLKPVSRSEQVEMEDIVAVGLIVKAVKNGFVVAYIVERRELRRIEEPPAPDTICYQEVSHSCGAEAKRRGSAGGAERAVRGVEITEQLARSKARTRRDLGDQTALVA